MKLVGMDVGSTTVKAVAVECAGAAARESQVHHREQAGRLQQRGYHRRCRLVLHGQDRAPHHAVAEHAAVEPLGHLAGWVDRVPVEGIEAGEQEVTRGIAGHAGFTPWRCRCARAW